MLAIFQQTCDNSSMNVILTMYNIKMSGKTLKIKGGTNGQN